MGKSSEREFTLMKAEISNNLKDRLLIELSNINSVHIKEKKKAKIKESLDEKEPLLEKIKNLRENLDDLFKKLKINPADFIDLNVEKEDRIEFVANNINDLINRMLEDIEFYTNRSIELNRYISKEIIDLEKLEVIKTSYKYLEEILLSRESISNLNQFNFRVFTTYTKNLNNLTNLFEFSEFPNFYETFEITEDRLGFYIFYPKDKEDEFNGRIRLIHSEEVSVLRKYLTNEGINFTRIEGEISSRKQELSRYRKELQRIIDVNIVKFAGISEIVQNIEEYNWVENQFESTMSNRLMLKFFVPTSKRKEIEQKLFTNFKDKIVIESIDVHRDKPVFEADLTKLDSKKGKKKGENITKKFKEEKFNEKDESFKGHDEEDDLRSETPSVMKNVSFFRPFETITKMYGTPTYSEIDPTPILAFTFPILFGLMFGDIGHGLTLIFAGLIGTIILRKKSRDTRNMAWIIFYCGVAAFFVGFLYGEYFGLHNIEIFGNVIWHLEPITIPILNLTLFDPLDNIMSVFYFAVIIGVFHINLGWFVQFLNYWKQKKRFLALSDSLIKILLLTGGTILILGFGFDIFGWLTFPFPILLTVIPGLLLLLLKPLGKVFKISYLEEETVGGLIGEGSIEAFDTVLSVMSNVASYIRLLALALAHIALLTSINAMVGLIEGEGIGIEIVHLIGSIFGNMVVILLEGLLVFLNSMRLHFYEFMGKFYQGSGIEFFPFYLDDDYSTIVFRVGAERDIISEEIDKEFEVKSGKEDVNRAVDYISEKYK
ncbi:MAG: V-type ATP synthase subunit I [Promethearchaeota archaeon]